MNRQALVGIFTIVALVGLFGVFLVLANVGTQGRYKIGVHFKSAAGLHKGALVYESGVVVGVVDQTNLLPETSPSTSSSRSTTTSTFRATRAS